MTVTISFAGSDDARVRSSSATYSTAAAGNALVIDTDSETLGTWGQHLDAGTFRLYEYFVGFPYVLNAAEQIVSSYFQFHINANNSGGPDRHLEVREYDFGATPSTGDWRTPGQLSDLPLLAQWEDIQSFAVGTRITTGSADLNARLNSTTGEVKVVCVSNRMRTSTTASSTEEPTHFTTADASTNTPRMVYTSILLSSLTRVMGAQVHLSDGTTVYLESDGAETATVRLKHRNLSGTVTTIHTLADNLGLGPGMQNYGLCRDSSNHLYVFSRNSGGENQIACQAFVKGSGHTWTVASAALNAPLPSSDGTIINNVVAVWHSTGNTIVVLAGHGAGHNSGVSISYLLINASTLRSGNSGFVRDSGSAHEIFYDTVSSETFQTNDTGTLFDICVAPGDPTRGYVVTATNNVGLDGAAAPSVARYTLNSSGTGFSNDAQQIGGGLNGSAIKKDANAKLRVIGISSSTFAVIVADADTNLGITVCLVQNSGTSTNFNNIVRSTLGDEGLATMPTPSAIAVSSAWDATYEPTTNTLWIYYLDTANSRRLLKTSVDLTTGFAVTNEVQVATDIGPVGSTNLGIRCHRGSSVGNKVLFALANRSSGGVFTTVYVEDTHNIPPFAPTLTPKANYNALNSATFDWVFNDPNPGDTQSAFQLEISLSGGAVVHDTGKVVSSTPSRVVAGGVLTNGNSYTWRVRTWDAQDLQGPYSSLNAFVTSASGVVNIVNPAIDNPPGVITKDNLVEWTVTGAVQAAYRIVVRRNDNEELFLNTGWIASTATSHLITNMLSDVEYRIEVTTRNASAVEANTATRLITPVFAAPEIPEITLTTNHAGTYITVSVVNPPPEGSRPTPIRNDIYRAGVDGLFTRVGNAPVNGEFKDYSAADGVAYQYFARAVTE